MKKGLILVLMLFVALVFSSPAQAVITVNDWTLNLSGIDGLPAGTVINDISEITYVGISHFHLFDANMNGHVDAGEFSEADGFLNATSLLDTGGGIIFGTGLNSTYQLTFAFSVDTYNYHVDPITHAVSFIHIPSSDPHAQTVGLLEAIVDGPAGGVTPASESTGDGYLDGVPIALFAVLYGGGGVFNPATFDGSDDATFALVGALPGVILNNMGDDMGVGGLLALTDANTDGDPTHAPNIGFTINTPTDWANYWTYTGAHTETDNFAEEDGSARLAVPEPSSILLLGLGLLGIAGLGRKRMKK